MFNGDDYIRDFLSTVGIEADILHEPAQKRVIVIETEVYEQRRAWIEAWFTLIRQGEKYSFFRERLRGTGKTEVPD